MALYNIDYVEKNEYSRPGIPLVEVRGVVIHWTGNKGATDEGHQKYFDGADGGGERYASAHMFVDKDSATLILPINEVAYQANEKACKIAKLKATVPDYKGGNANLTTLSIELCVEKDGTIHTDTIKRAEKIAAEWVKKFKLDPLKDIYRHHDVTGKNCPAPWVAKPELFENFKKAVKVINTPAPKKVAPKKVYTSLVDFLIANKQPYDFVSRHNLAKKHGILGYNGTAEQNIKLLEILQK